MLKLLKLKIERAQDAPRQTPEPYASYGDERGAEPPAPAPLFAPYEPNVPVLPPQVCKGAC